MLVMLNLPLIGMWIKLLTVPYRCLFPAIVLFCAIGVYSPNNNAFDVWMIALFGVLGYVFDQARCEPAPLLLGFILGPMMEENLRRALLLSRGDPSVFVTRPISAGLLVGARAARRRRPADDPPAPRCRLRRRRSSNPDHVTVRSTKIVSVTSDNPHRGWTSRTVWDRRFNAPLRSFLRTETGSARVVLVAAVAALVWANVDASSYESVWGTPLSVRLGDWRAVA